MAEQDGVEDAVVIERSLGAPVELVWQMWTVPEHFQAWYGPDGAAGWAMALDKLAAQVGKPIRQPPALPADR